MDNAQETLPMPDSQDIAAPIVEDAPKEGASKITECCRTFSYLCPVCNPR